MAALVEPWVAEVGLVTWAPTSPDRRRARGFDQAELLARGVAAALALPVAGTLDRRRGPAQTGRPAAERAIGVAFTAARRAGVAARDGPRSVLVVDDVITTGATLAAAAVALRAAGFESVNAVTAARTPLKPPEGDADA